MIGDSNQASLATVRLALLLSCPVYSGEKEKANRAYCSSTSWPNSIFPNSSMELRVPKICQKYKADQDTIYGKTQIRPHHSIVKQTSSLSFFSTNTLFTLFFLVLAGPTNDISNLRHLSVGGKKSLAKRSSAQTVDIAKRALSEFGLSQVVILARPRRCDSYELEELSQMSNGFLELFCKEESKISFGSNQPMYNFR